MKHIIAGTAGHIDHGKTALVRALTGIETDRWEEEKRRGITIDLGFAHLQLTPSVLVGFVDVPGHERFVRNMLAGAGGIDVVLFVVSAEESIKPQTREHFDICRLLGVERGIVVLTKADLVDRDIVDLVRLEMEDFVAGSFLEGAPVVAVSAVTGEGLEELRAALASVAAETRAKNAARHFRLPVDRAFTMKGFGAVVTGTLVAGSVNRDDEVEVHPAGKRSRVRGVQVHGEAAERAIAGQRTALNLPDIPAAELARGMTLTHPGLFRPVRHLDARIELVPSAPPLKHRAPVHFHSGAAEIGAEVRLLGGAASIEPGAAAWARIVLREPALLLPGDRFILRRFSPVITIGGGVIADISGRRYRRTDDAAARLAVLAGLDDGARVALLVREAPFGLSRAEVIARTGLLAADIERIAASPAFVTLRNPEPWLCDAAWFTAAASKLAERVTVFHKKNPLLPGVPKQDLRGRDLAASPAPLYDALLAAARGVAVEGDTVRLASHRLVLKQDEEEARAKIEQAFAAAGLSVPSLNEVLAKSGVEPARAKSILQMLLREKRLIRTADDLVFHESAIAALRQQLGSRRGERFSVPVFKDWTGISRKYAIPLLEYLDRERVTRRDEDERIVL